MLLQAALNGARAARAHPALPVTSPQLAAAAAESVAAGAGAIHFHVRGPDGRESLAPEDVAQALAAVRAAVPGTPVGVSTGAWIVRDPALRLTMVGQWTALPDYASVNFHEEGAVALAQLLRSRGVGIEAGVGNRQAAECLADSGLRAQCLRILLEPSEQEADIALRMVAQLEAILDRAAVRLPRLLHGIDATAWRLIAEAVARSYDTRVGLEDTLALPDGRVAPGNAALVAAARREVAAYEGRR